MSGPVENLPDCVTGTFIRPCLACGATAHVVDTVEQPHDCVLPDELSELVAKAWWNGYDARANCDCTARVQDFPAAGGDDSTTSGARPVAAGGGEPTEPSGVTGA